MTPPQPQPPAQKSNVLLWILIGVGGFFALLAVMLIAGGLFMVHKVRQTGRFEVKSADGTVQIGGDAKIPTWVPEYPGSSPQTAFAAQGRDGRSGTFMFTTKDSPDRVAKYYREQLEGAGLPVAAVVDSGSGQIITAKDKAGQRTVTVLVGSGNNETAVNVTYSNK